MTQLAVASEDLSLWVSLWTVLGLRLNTGNPYPPFYRLVSDVFSEVEFSFMNPMPRLLNVLFNLCIRLYLNQNWVTLVSLVHWTLCWHGPFYG